MKKNHDQTASLISLRATLLEVVATALFIALGVNCVAAGLALQLGWPGWGLIALGASLSAGGSAYLAARVAPRINGEFSFQGVLPVKGKGHDVIAIDRYRFAEKAAEYFRALTAENRALAKAWSDNPLTTLEFDPKEGRASRRSSPAVKLVHEAIEYFVLNELSLHVSAHFVNNPKVDDHELTEIGRREIPSVLLENHFLELFSKPMEEREAFLHRRKSIEIRHEHKVVWATGKGGALFDHFELILPRGTTVSRIDPRSIQLKTDRFSIRIVVGFEGCNAVFPGEFERLYLGYGVRDVTAYHVDLDITVHFSPWSLLSARGWEYYRWLDSFLDRMEAEFSFDRFLEDIGWETALSTAIVRKHMAAASQTGSTDTPGEEQPKPKTADGEAGSGESPAGPVNQGSSNIDAP